MDMFILNQLISFSFEYLDSAGKYVSIWIYLF